MLKVRRLETGYGKKQVLFGVSLDVHQGEMVALIGPNGAGKSTLLRAACGLTPVWSGEVLFNGERIDGAAPARNLARGIVFGPQGNRVFDELTVLDNLVVGGCQLPSSELETRIAAVLATFPALRDRLRTEAGKLSGGEQQMLALGRVLMPKPTLLMLDEPSLGLSPDLANTVFSKIAEINRETGVSMLIVEQKVREVLDICNRVYSMKLGRVAFEGAPDELKHDGAKLRQLFL